MFPSDDLILKPRTLEYLHYHLLVFFSYRLKLLIDITESYKVDIYWKKAFRLSSELVAIEEHEDAPLRLHPGSKQTVDQLATLDSK